MRPYLRLFFTAVVVCYAVAWGCVLWAPYTRTMMPPSEVKDRSLDKWWEPPKIVGPHGREDWWFTADGIGAWQSVPSRFRMSDGIGFLYWKGQSTPAYYRGGWPMLAVESTITIQDGRSAWDLPLVELLRRGLPTDRLPGWLHARDDRRLPLVPIFPGLAVDTALVFAGLVAVGLIVKTKRPKG